MICYGGFCLELERQRSGHIGLGLVLDLAKRQFCLCLFRRNIVFGW